MFNKVLTYLLTYLRWTQKRESFSNPPSSQSTTVD